MRFNHDVNNIATTIPAFHDKALPIIRKLSKFSKPKLMKLMSISSDLANTNLDRYRTFSTDPNLGTLAPAIHAFNGDVYLGLDSQSFTSSDINYANDHLRILSGLYGLLRPIDNIQPYRLEMGSRLPVGRKINLYAYWKDDIAKQINSDLSQLKEQTIINLASKEYFQAVDLTQIKTPIITVHFREYRDGVLRSIQFNLKRARGLLARFIINNKLKTTEGIKGFDTDGYTFESDMSDHDNWFFVR